MTNEHEPDRSTLEPSAADGGGARSPEMNAGNTETGARNTGDSNTGEVQSRVGAPSDYVEEVSAAPDETLSALDDLESLLTDRHDLPVARDATSVVSVPVVDPHVPGVTTDGANGGIEHDGQYTIPLLQDVVRPGAAAGADAPDRSINGPLDGHVDGALDGPITLSPMAQRLFDRLASEIDVIVQTGVDDALKAAARDIRKRVKQHVAIVLPEILDELAHGDDDEPL